MTASSSTRFTRRRGITAAICVTPALFQDELRRRLVITLNMSRVIQHVLDAVRRENAERLELVFDRDHPIRSTSEMKPGYTGKPCAHTKKSHINFCVYDSTWEASHAFALDTSETVAAWVKNDHIGCEIPYLYQGVVRKYRPDFLVRLANGEMLILETKGEESEQDVVKHRALDEWVRAVNAHGGFDRWHWAVARGPSEIGDVLARVFKARNESSRARTTAVRSALSCGAI